MAEELLYLPGPFEILELQDGKTIRLRITEWAYGKMLIKPRYYGAPEEKEINVLRLHVDPSFKPTAPHYWDFTAGTAIASILPELRAKKHQTHVLVLTAHGEAPKKRFTVAWI
jgi:hypothetical protein